MLVNPVHHLRLRRATPLLFHPRFVSTSNTQLPLQANGGWRYVRHTHDVIRPKAGGGGGRRRNEADIMFGHRRRRVHVSSPAVNVARAGIGDGGDVYLTRDVCLKGCVVSGPAAS
jgi:hypothetical protein